MTTTERGRFRFGDTDAGMSLHQRLQAEYARMTVGDLMRKHEPEYADLLERVMSDD
jgi:hypothetical protein